MQRKYDHTLTEYAITDTGPAPIEHTHLHPSHIIAAADFAAVGAVSALASGIAIALLGAAAHTHCGGAVAMLKLSLALRLHQRCRHSLHKPCCEQLSLPQVCGGACL